MEETNVKLAPPWIQYVNALEAMFGKDPEIQLVYSNDDVTVTLRVDNQAKADALVELLPDVKVFGNVTLKIRIVPGNTEMTKAQLIRTAFGGNPALHQVITISEIPGMMLSNPITYVIFEKEVVQYYNDNLNDAHGNRTTLYEEIARELFPETGGELFFCTDNGRENVGKPLGEWP